MLRSLIKKLSSSKTVNAGGKIVFQNVLILVGNMSNVIIKVILLILIEEIGFVLMIVNALFHADDCKLNRDWSILCIF